MLRTIAQKEDYSDYIEKLRMLDLFDIFYSQFHMENDCLNVYTQRDFLIGKIGNDKITVRFMNSWLRYFMSRKQSELNDCL